MTYQDSLNRHLAGYKASALGIDEPGGFRQNGKLRWYDHILPEALADLNLLPGVLALERVHGLRPRRHQYFRHLNSSQAFAYNLFLPFFDGGPEAGTALLRALGQDGTVTSWELEAIPVPEEGSNLDALWTTSTGLRIVCEVKLSESEFGTAENDDRHRRKLAEIYRPGLEGLVIPESLEAPAFFDHYQVFRNVWHMCRVPPSELLFLMPRANVRLWAAIGPALDRLLPGARERVRLMAIEEVLSALVGDEACPAELRGYAKSLTAKYIVPA